MLILRKAEVTELSKISDVGSYGQIPRTPSVAHTADADNAPRRVQFSPLPQLSSLISRVREWREAGFAQPQRGRKPFDALLHEASLSGQVRLDVTFVTQRSIGAHVLGETPRNDPTGCWYASACMVGHFFEAGPRIGVPELFVRRLDKGLLGHLAIGSDEAEKLVPGSRFTLAEREQLKTVQDCAEQRDYSLTDLKRLLLQAGPILFSWMKKGTSGNQPYGHASVIIGVDNGKLIFHDPEDAPYSSMTVSQFNFVRRRFEFGMMQRVSGEEH